MLFVEIELIIVEPLRTASWLIFTHSFHKCSVKELFRDFFLNFEDDIIWGAYKWIKTREYSQSYNQKEENLYGQRSSMYKEKIVIEHMNENSWYHSSIDPELVNSFLKGSDSNGAYSFFQKYLILTL